jgi:hypothetical protein
VSSIARDCASSLDIRSESIAFMKRSVKALTFPVIRAISAPCPSLLRVPRKVRGTGRRTSPHFCTCEIEELRAKSGGIQPGASQLFPDQPQAQAGSADATGRLQRAKEMLDKGLITDSETIKARILGNL